MTVVLTTDHPAWQTGDDEQHARAVRTPSGIWTLSFDRQGLHMTCVHGTEDVKPAFVTTDPARTRRRSRVAPGRSASAGHHAALGQSVALGRDHHRPPAAGRPRRPGPQAAIGNPGYRNLRNAVAQQAAIASGRRLGLGVDLVDGDDKFFDQHLVLLSLGMPCWAGQDQRLCQSKSLWSSAQQFAGDDDGVHHADSTRAQHLLDG
ncbi:hypothetical protein [Streptomyces sp. GESEQ-35]|uniref:hypothetical protein n=1 Tax=Streptomyces sp. GESEQ-35 TaxID=2812657 RepID=UPI001B33F8D1|nr:hypothetical protein [Streptomyces sp. GESEQ-35]